MSSSRERGAVHIMFLIITLVIALIGWVLWYLQLTENEQAVADKEAAVANESAALDTQFKYKRAFDSLAQAVGEIPDLPESKGEVESAEEYLQNIDKQHVQPVRNKIRAARSFFNGDESMNTLMAATQPAEGMVNQLQAEITSLKADLSTARSEKSAASQANDQMLVAHGNELEQRNQQENQLRQRHATKEQQLEGQRDDVQGKLGDITNRYEDNLNKHRDEVLALRDRTDSLDRSVRDWKRELRIVREANRPDGKIIDVNHAQGRCWINVGSKHGLRRGTRFRTYGFLKGGVKEYHGYVVVRSLERDRSECAIESDAPVQRGDFVTNPFFQTEETKHFYFLGKLPGRFDNQRSKAILERFGAEVDGTFSVATDFLVLGDNPDPDAAVGEDANPNWFKDTTEYNDALRWGVEMMRARDLETFLQY